MRNFDFAPLYRATVGPGRGPREPGGTYGGRMCSWLLPDRSGVCRLFLSAAPWVRAIGPTGSLWDRSHRPRLMGRPWSPRVWDIDSLRQTGGHRIAKVPSDGDVSAIFCYSSSLRRYVVSQEIRR